MFRRVFKSSTVLDIINKCKNHRRERRLYNTLVTQMTEFQSGLKVATEETCSPLACVSLYILTGSRFENECNNGISYFIEHMAFKGFRSMKQECLESKMNKIGGTLSAHTSREYQRFTAVAPADSVLDLICILSQIVSDMEFPIEAVQNEKLKIYSELLENDVNPKILVFDYLHQTAFQGTPLAQPVTPTSQNLNAFDCNDANTFMQENYLPKRLVLSLSGGICHNNAVNVIQQCFICDQGSGCYKKHHPQRYTGSQIIYRNDSLPYLHVAIAVEAPGYNSDDYLPLLVASCLTNSWHKSQGGNMNNASLLARSSAANQLCEMFDSFYIAYSDVGLWGVYFITEMNGADDIVYNIQKCWMHLCTTLSHNELQRAINIAKLKLARNVNGVINSCHDIGLQFCMTNRRKSLDLLYNEMKKMTPKTLKEIGLKYIYNKCPVVAAVGPSEALPDYERIKTGLYWLRY